jgi:hypothetical protein
MSPYPIFGNHTNAGNSTNILYAFFAETLNRHGLSIVTDVEAQSTGGNILGLGLDAEAIEQLKAKSGWDDTPIAEKLFSVLIQAACRPQRTPTPVVFRMIGIAPTTHQAVILIAHTFYPVAAADIADLTKVARWALSVRDGTCVPSHFSGSILDHGDLAGAIELITAICAKRQEELKLLPVGQGRQTMMGSLGPAGAERLEGYVDAPADYRNIERLVGEMEEVPPGEGFGHRRKAPPAGEG